MLSKKKKNYFLKLKTEAFKTSLKLSTKRSGIPARETSQRKPNQTLRKITNQRDLRHRRNKLNTVKEENAKKQFNF